ncbi:MAG: hypothetical protein ACOZF0_13120 [Thermodesulfobacteriota bacterium]
MESTPTPCLSILLEQPAFFSIFYPFLSKGVQIPIAETLSIRDFLNGYLRLEPAYAENRIQTIFLNGRAVDDLATAMLSGGDTLALSAAMPGLVGASFRRSGNYSVFRDNVSLHAGQSGKSRGAGMVTLKLFNLIVSEIGPRVLRQGVHVPPKLLPEILDALDAASETAAEARLDDRPVALPEIRSRIPANKTVVLRIQSGQESGALEACDPPPA